MNEPYIAHASPGATGEAQPLVSERCEGESPSAPPPDRSELERRLAEIELSVRAEMEAVEAEKGDGAAPARRVYASIDVRSERRRAGHDQAKVVVAKGLDPRLEETMLMRRARHLARGDGARRGTAARGLAIGPRPSSVGPTKNSAGDLPDDYFAPKRRLGLWLLGILLVSGLALAAIVIAQNLPYEPTPAGAGEPVIDNTTNSERSSDARRP